MTRSEESAMYDLGRQAREAGYEIRACNVRDPIKRAWWIAGHHDLAIEKGNNKYFNETRERAA